MSKLKNLYSEDMKLHEYFPAIYKTICVREQDRESITSSTNSTRCTCSMCSRNKIEIKIEIPIPYDFKWPEIPERSAVFSLADVTKVTKKFQTGKDKSINGFIWVDTDPLQILLNKFIIRSCHTLDNTDNEMRGGNFAHVYNPYMACVFAGRYHPDEATINTKSPISSRYYQFNYTTKEIHYDTIPMDEHDFRKNIQMRSYGAVANIFIVFDSLGNPYIFLGRIYDSCAENPWAYSIFTYVRDFAESTGFGFILGDSMGCVINSSREVSIYKRVKVVAPTVESTYYYSARFNQYRDTILEYYGDDDLEYLKSTDIGSDAPNLFRICGRLIACSNSNILKKHPLHIPRYDNESHMYADTIKYKELPPFEINDEAADDDDNDNDNDYEDEERSFYDN